ncbi:MAG: DNA repair protein RecN, partial [Clostridia bacterium]|nr:DNA repair protein RecN [Clostridia bacterium]
GFNVLTGETGAGKSLIIDSLNFLMGSRADKSLIKYGRDFAKVEGKFDVDEVNPDITDVLRDFGLENEGTIIISRYFTHNGKNECKINGEVVTLNMLRKLSILLIDIFGQHDSQILLDSTKHLGVFDIICEKELDAHKFTLNSLLKELDVVKDNIKALGGLDSDREKNIELLEFEIEEISKADLKENEDDELNSRKQLMLNAEKIYNALDQALGTLDGEYPITETIKASASALSSIEKYNEDIVKQKDRLYSLRFELEDVVENLKDIQNMSTYSEYELDKIEERLEVIKDLERKYGNSIPQVLEYLDNAKARLNDLLNADERLDSLRKEKEEILDRIYSVVIDMSNVRKTKAVSFEKELIEEIKMLGMKNVSFKVDFKNNILRESIEKDITPDGVDDVEFLFSANLGQPMLPLAKIISGGELSRFMLAFKCVLNNSLNRTFIFDEIDTGIGGNIGSVVGEKICKISTENQVIVVTHLAQIAAFGDRNFLIEKFDQDNETVTSVKTLSAEDKVKEISRMIGNMGSETTAIRHAEELIQVSNTFKEQLKNR